MKWLTRTSLILLGFLLGCGDRDPPLPTLETPDVGRGIVHIQTPRNTHIVQVEIAETPDAHAYGLMDRDSLGVNEGMLFVFDTDVPGDNAFYMYRTRIPLDIAFADEEGRILWVTTMEPCTHQVAAFCPRYAPGSPYRLVLEVNGGYFLSNGVTIGDRLAWERK